MPDTATLPAREATEDIPDFRVVLPSSENSVRRALEQIKTFSEPLDLTIEESGTVEIVLAEALNNIVEHAYAESDGLIVLVVNREAEGLVFTITDGGKEMPSGKLPVGKLRDYPDDPDEMPEGGFGWFLIHDLTHNLVYERQDGKNVLQFRLALGALEDA